MTPSSGHRLTFVFVACLALAVGAGGAGALALANSGSDEDSRDAVDFSKVTPLPPLVGTRTVPDYDHPSACTAAPDERPDPASPPLSCRSSGSEPSTGAIPTPDGRVARPAAPTAPGITHIHNPAFRLTIDVPDDWYSDMRPEGGAFSVSNPAATLHATTGTDVPGSITMSFSARDYVPSAVGLGKLETALESPNTSIAGSPAVTIDEGDAEGSRWLRTAFRRDDVLYIIDAYVVTAADDSEAEFSRVTQVLATVNIY